MFLGAIVKTMVATTTLSIAKIQSEMGKHTMIRLVCAPFRRLQDALEPERLDARHDTISLGATFYGQSKRQLRHAVRTSVIVDRILFLVEIKYDLGYTHVSSIAGSGVSKSEPILGEQYEQRGTYTSGSGSRAICGNRTETRGR